MRVTVAGAGGALGGHLVKRLYEDGHEVRAVDIKPAEEWWQYDDRISCWELCDLRDRQTCEAAVAGVEQVFNLAADMGGIGHITEREADCAMTVLATANLLRAASEADVERFCYTSSACIYPTTLQEYPRMYGLREYEAWPALPDHGYGLEKLFGEKLCEYVASDYGMTTRVARLHNVYGHYGAWIGGREKAPAAICRKVAEAKHLGSGKIEIWGDGEQTRSFMYVDDFVEGIIRIMDSDYPYPLNLGTEEQVSINQLVSLVEEIAEVRLERRYVLDAPQGVRGRNSDNTLIREVLDWEPSIPLERGLRKLYPWVEEQVLQRMEMAL